MGITDGKNVLLQTGSEFFSWRIGVAANFVFSTTSKDFNKPEETSGMQSIGFFEHPKQMSQVLLDKQD